MAVIGITMAARTTTMEDQDLRITATIHPGRLPPMDTTRIRTIGTIRIRTTGVIQEVTLIISRDMGTTLQRLQRCNADWVSSAIIRA